MRDRRSDRDGVWLQPRAVARARSVPRRACRVRAGHARCAAAATAAAARRRRVTRIVGSSAGAARHPDRRRCAKRPRTIAGAAGRRRRGARARTHRGRSVGRVGACRSRRRELPIGVRRAGRRSRRRRRSAAGVRRTKLSGALRDPARAVGAAAPVPDRRGGRAARAPSTRRRCSPSIRSGRGAPAPSRRSWPAIRRARFACGRRARPPAPTVCRPSPKAATRAPPATRRSTCASRRSGSRSRRSEKRLACEGLMDARKHKPGVYDTEMRTAMLDFQQKHAVMDQADIKRATLEALARPPLENDFLALRRVLTERAMHAAGFIEDGSVGEIRLGSVVPDLSGRGRRAASRPRPGDGVTGRDAGRARHRDARRRGRVFSPPRARRFRLAQGRGPAAAAARVLQPRDGSVGRDRSRRRLVRLPVRRRGRAPAAAAGAVSRSSPSTSSGAASACRSCAGGRPSAAGAASWPATGRSTTATRAPTSARASGATSSRRRSGFRRRRRRWDRW